MGEGATAGRQSTVAAVAALVRVPNLFTAPPDVVLGAALAAGAGAAVDPLAVAGLAVASALLYAGGTALNDAFDAPVDAIERPERPIPSGAVSRRTGFGLGALLLLAGVGAAFAMTGAVGGAVAAAIAVGIVLYDGALKGGTAGFVTLGLVRGLNVLLGTAVGDGLVSTSWLLPPAAVAAYVTAVTFMADRETEGGNRPAILVAAFAATAGVLAVGVQHALTDQVAFATGLGVALGVAFLAWTGSALRTAYCDPSPETVGPAVGTCVLGLVVLDGAFAAAVGVAWALAAVAFLLPAIGFARAYDVT